MTFGRSLSRYQTRHRFRQVLHVVDEAIGLEACDRYICVAEADPDHGNSGPPGNADVGSGIPDHDAGGQLPPGPGDRLAQDVDALGFEPIEMRECAHA